MREKRRLTEELVGLLPADLAESTESAMLTWWYNIRASGGMRLTDTGFRRLSQDLGLTYYDYAIDDPAQFNQQTVLKLDKKMQTPYYIHAVKRIPKSISFFGSREAVALNLYRNLAQFLDNYHP